MQPTPTHDHPQLTPSTQPWPPHLQLTLNNNSIGHMLLSCILISHILISHMPISCTLIGCTPTSRLLDMHPSAAYPPADTKQQFHWPHAHQPHTHWLHTHQLPAGHAPVIHIPTGLNRPFTSSLLHPSMPTLHCWCGTFILCDYAQCDLPKSHHTWCGLLLTWLIFFLYITYFLFLNLHSYFHAMKV